MVDGKFNIRSAAMPLRDNGQGKLTADEFQVAVEVKQEIHCIDRFHIKSACIAGDDSIVVVARGRVPQMREQIALLILRFVIVKKGEIWRLQMRETI